MDPEQHRFRRPLRDLVSKSPFDVIVVGAGSAGCALVGKLCRERPDLNVLLVEAGAEAHTSDLIADPRRWLQTFGTANDWNYEGEPHRRLTEADGKTPRRMAIPRGKTLGGSSSINAMMWAENTPYEEAFMASAEWLGATRAVDLNQGLCPVEASPVATKILSPEPAAGSLGNGGGSGDTGESAGLVGQSLFNADLEGRQDAFTAYVEPLLRANVTQKTLTIVSQVLVRKVLLEPVQTSTDRTATHRAVGVELESLEVGNDGTAEGPVAIQARCEVVLCAGAVNTPQLLLLSGIGDATPLRKAGVVPVVQLPGGHLTEPADMLTLMWAVRKAYELMKAEPFASMIDWSRGTSVDDAVGDDDKLERYLRRAMISINHYAGVTSLNVGSTNLRAEGAKHIAAALPECKALADLNMSNNNLGRKWTNAHGDHDRNDSRNWETDVSGIKALAAAIPECKALEKLLMGANGMANNLPKNVYGDVDGWHGPGFAKGLADGIKYNRAMVTINIMGNNIGKEQLSKLQDIMKVHPTLVSLCGIADNATEANLSGLRMDADDAVILADELPAKGAMAKLIFGGDGQIYGGHASPATLEVGMIEVVLRNDYLGVGGAIIVGAWISHRDNGAMVKFDVSNNDIRAGGGKALGDALKDNQVLQELNIASNKLNLQDNTKFSDTDMSGVIAISNAIPTMGALATITFGDTFDHDKDGTVTLSTSMTEADFSSKNLGPSGAVHIVAAFFPKCQVMTKLDISSNYKPEEGLTLRAQGYSNKSAEFIKPIAEMLKTNTTVTELNVSSNWLNAEAGRVLSDAISANRALTTLNMSANKLTRGKLKANPHTSDSYWVSQDSSYESDMSGVIALADGIKNNGALVKFDISSNCLCEKGTKALAEALKGNQIMSELNISGNQMTRGSSGFSGKMSGVIAIADAIPTIGAMTSLNVSNNDLCAEGAKHVAEAIKVHGGMTNLNICHNNIKSQGAKLFAGTLREASATISLKSLNLSDNEIDDDDQCRNLFVHLVIKQPSIMHIEFAGNRIHAEIIAAVCDTNAKHQPGESPCHCLCEKLAQTLQQVPGLLEEYKEQLEQLIDEPSFDAAAAADKKRRTLLAIAEGVDPQSELSDFIRQKTLFLGVYKIAHGDPAHKSATCIVSLADDFSNGNAPVPVALKFMRNADQFAREIEVRKEQDLGSEFVVGVTKSYGSALDAADSDETKKQLAKIQRKSVLEFASLEIDSQDAQHFANAIKSTNHGIYQDYRFCIVLPRATRGLQEVITHDHIAGVAERILDVKAHMQQIGDALGHLHDKGVIHADLKPLNVMYAEGRWKLIDLDAAATIGAAAGLKSSTGYIPPELLIIEGDSARVRNPENSAERLIARETFDIWSFGVLLYLLVTGEPLFKNNQQDNLTDEELLNLAKWDNKQLEKVLLKVHNKRKQLHRPLARDLLQQLLASEPNDRPESFEEVLGHPFFTGETDSKLTQEIHAKLDMLLENQERVEKMLKVIDGRQIEITEVSDRTYLQLRKTEQVLLRGMFVATEVTIPTSFIITPFRLEPKEEKKNKAAPLLSLAEDGSGLKLSSAGEERKAEMDKRKGWFDQVCSLGRNLTNAVTGGSADGLVAQVKDKVVEFVKNELQDQPMYLYLIDECTGEPVVPNADAGPYPIAITTPSTTAVKLLPIMRTGLKVMSVVNGTALVGNMLGLRIPCVPEEWRKKANEAVGGLDKKSSVAEYDILQSSVDGAKDETRDGEGAEGGYGGKGTKERLRGGELREYERFLLEKDPDNLFSGLNRLVTPEGQACWTLLKSQNELDEVVAQKQAGGGNAEAQGGKGAEEWQKQAQEAAEAIEALKKELEDAKNEEAERSSTSPGQDGGTEIDNENAGVTPAGEEVVNPISRPETPLRNAAQMDNVIQALRVEMQQQLQQQMQQQMQQQIREMMAVQSTISSPGGGAGGGCCAVQ
eukprot:g186.t1